MTNRQLYIDIGHSQVQKHGNEVCGDAVMFSRIKEENRTLAVLSDGLGSGIKANILATMTATMALQFMKTDTPVEHTARTIMNTLPVDRFRKVSFASFSIIDLNQDRNIRLIEFGNPQALVIRNNKFIEPAKSQLEIANKKLTQALYKSEFTLEEGDRVILCSDGVTQSGIGQVTMPFGWQQERLKEFVLEELDKQAMIPSESLARKIVMRSRHNDQLYPKDDISCLCVHVREPRRLLVCTGPPFKKENDAVVAKELIEFKGKKAICGGTTAQIISRELNSSIEVDLSKKTEGLPPSAIMEGIDLVTEGILTIGRVAEILEDKSQEPNLNAENPAILLLKLFLQNDEIIFQVGTRVNNAHQDPELPVELEFRRNVIKRIAAKLEDRYLKKTKIRYI